jgi:glyoxylase-like metal-dependent hydrolase (beta-lactamase superfamily II)
MDMIEISPIRVTRYDVLINYSYIIINTRTRETVIVDPAWEYTKLEQTLLRKNAEVRAVLLTHSHFDHTNLADRFAEEHGCDVFMDICEIDAYHFRCKNLIPLHGSGNYLAGSVPFEVIHTPGHTIGSVCFLVEGGLFTGDTLFIEGCGLCWGFGANPDQMYESLECLKNRVSKEIRIFPGHSYGEQPGRSFGYVLEKNIYLNMRNRKQFVEFRMRKNQKNLFAFK